MDCRADLFFCVQAAKNKRLVVRQCNDLSKADCCKYTDARARPPASAWWQSTLHEGPHPSLFLPSAPFLPFSRSLLLSIVLPFFLSLLLSFSLSLFRSLFLSLSPSFSFSLPFHLSIFPSFSLPLFPSSSPSVHFSFSLHLSLFLSTFLSFSPSLLLSPSFSGAFRHTDCLLAGCPPLARHLWQLNGPC